MLDRDTQMGGPDSRFPSTSLGIAAGRDLRGHLEGVSRRYWRPVYLHIRRSGSRTNEEAKDLTQAFFVHLLENEVLSRFDPRRGNFRAFLKACLRNFLASEARDAARLKRGGQVRFASVEEWREVFAETLPAEEATEESFDREWLREVLRQAVEELRERLHERGRGTAFEVFRRHDLAEDGAAPSYAESAAALGISLDDVGNFLRSARLELRRILTRHIAGYVSDEEEILEEEDRLLGPAP